jgi:hypothetical protein
MGTFDASFLNPKLKKTSSQDYGFLVDQIAVKKNQLESDGKLSPGDYDILIGLTRQVYSHPGLTPAQRSNVGVQLSGFEKEKKTSLLSDNSNIGTLNDDVKDTNSKLVMHYGNDPTKFLAGQSALLSAKMDRLSENINNQEASGQDTSAQENELTNTIQQYNDTLQALDDVKKHAADPTYKSDFAAYITTNSQGEITDVKVDRAGTNSGYLQSNGSYGGLVVYGKPNSKDASGTSVFKLGMQTFKESKSIGPDGQPQNSLIAGAKGGYNLSNNTPVELDPKSLKTQQSVRSGGFIEGEKGFFYQNNGDGSYTKYTGTDRDKLKARFNLQDGDIHAMPKSFVQGILPSVTKTDDGSVPVTMPPTTGPINTTGMTAPTQSQEPALAIASQTPAGAPDAQTPGGRPNTGGAPTTRAPFDSGGLAGRVMSGAKSFLGSLFGQ